MTGISDKRGKLFYEYIRVLKDKQPKFFLAENVPGIISRRHVDNFLNIINFIRALGYNVKFKKINTVDYGIPQTRQRIIIVGFKNSLGIDDFVFPKIIRKKIKTLKDAISDLPESMPAKNKYYTNGMKLDINAHEHLVRSFSTIYMSRNRRREWNEPAYTVEASGRFAKIHPSALPMIKIDKDKWIFDTNAPYRRLSIRECARIQTFPDNFNFFYRKLDNGYKMVGNAVPVKLSYILANKIKITLLNNTK